MLAILAAETLISLVGELFDERSSNAGLDRLLAATLLRPALAGFFARKQSLHISYANWLYVPFLRNAKSSNSFPHLHLNLIGCAPFGGLTDWRGGCCLPPESCLDAFLYEDAAAAVVALSAACCVSGRFFGFHDANYVVDGLLLDT